MLQEMAQLGVMLVGGQLVHIGQAPVHSPLQVQGAFHSFDATLPVVV